MTTSTIIWNLVIFITISGLSVLVHGKRHKPTHDEIERVFNDTHSFIWKCSNSECAPGMGLNVFCGTSVPISMPIKCVFCVKGVNFSSNHDYSTCQSCRNCGKHENKTGECTLEVDTTTCLGTCHKGFYMDKITGDCHPCSDCCSSIEGEKYHEKQCENSGLPTKQQCRMSNMKCHHPTKADKDRDDHDQEDDQQGGLIPLEIAAIVIGFTIFIIIIALLFVFWKYYSWPQAKRILKACCCCCCRLLKSKGGNTVNSHISDHFEGDYLESTATTMSGSRLLAEQADVIASLPSDVTVGTTKPSKRSGFQRQFSVPVETQSNANLKIPRSSSHPGCLNLKELSKLPAQELSDTKLGSLKKKILEQRRKKLTKKGYTPVPTDQPLENDDLPPAANLGKDCFHKQTSSGEFPGNTLQPVVVAHDLGKERLGKPSVKEQCTSTTGLHQSGTTQVVPQEFLSQCLSQKFSAIPIKFYRKICLKLDILRKCFWDDYRLLGEKIGLSRDEITWLGQNGNPTESIIQKFDSQKGSSIGKFKAILKNMKRNDVETIIEEWIQDEWHKSNSSSVVLPDGKGPDYKFHSLV